MTPTEMFDVVIAGAGPAGSVTAARLAQHGLKVLLVEASRFDRHRVGEFLTPAARALVNEAALLKKGWESRHQEIPEFVSTWSTAEPVSRNYIFNPHGQGLALNRALFDRELADTAMERGARLLTNSYVRAASRTTDGWEITLEHDGQQFQVSCKFLAACCGRAGAPFPGLPHMRRRDAKLVCLALRLQHYGGNVCPTTEAYPNGWVYTVGLSSGELIVNLFTECSGLRRPSLDLLLRELTECPLAASRVLASNITDASEVRFFSTDASSTSSRPAAGSGWCLAGDAAQSLDPLSSGGIMQALQHALLISDSLLSSPSFTEVDWHNYTTYLEQSYSDYAISRRGVYGLEQRWKTPFWSGADQIISGRR
jgi:flavin-dependent dehydrogenase